MRATRIGGLVLLGAWLWGGGWSRAESLGDREDLAALEALTGQWIALRTELAGEQRIWEQQQAHWQQEIDLLQQEVATLTAQWEDDAGFLSNVEQRQVEIMAQKDAMEQALGSLRSVVERHERELRGWALRVPPGLQAGWGTGFGALPAEGSGATGQGLLRRLQTVLTLYTQVETLQNNVHLVRELVEVDGIQREAEVLYLGLSRGFAVSTVPSWAAIGVPSDAGWVWQAHPEQASNIRLAVRVWQREAEVRFVPLLLEVGEEYQP